MPKDLLTLALQRHLTRAEETGDTERVKALKSKINAAAKTAKAEAAEVESELASDAKAAKAEAAEDKSVSDNDSNKK